MRNRGLTFLEILISLIIFTVAMLGIFQIFNVALDAQHRARQEIIAINLARGLTAEIMAKNFVDPDEPTNNALGLNPGESFSNRQTLDDVDDYNGYDESAAGYPTTVGNQAMNGSVVGIPDYSGFSRSVNVVYCDSNINCPAAGPSDYKRARVTVNNPYAKNIIIDEVTARPVP